MKREDEIARVTVAGSVVNLLLVGLKAFAGVAGHSAAMVSDAVHSLSDFVTDIVVLVFVRVSARPQDEDHDYGHGKFETLATLLIGLALAAAAIGIVVGGAVKLARWLQGEDLPAPGKLALWAALVSIVVGAMLVKVAWDLLGPSFGELTDSSLPAETEQEMLDLITSVPGVEDPHNLRTRRIGNLIAAEVHIRLDGSQTLEEAHEKASEVERRFRERFGRESHIIVHMEPLK